MDAKDATASGSETRPEESASGSQTQLEESASGSQTQLDESASGSQTQLEESGSGSQSQPEESASGSQTQPEESASGSQTQPEESASGSQTQLEESASGSQSQPEESASGSQTHPEESASGSQSQPVESASATQTLCELLNQMLGVSMTKSKTIKQKNYVKLDPVKTRKFLLTKLRPHDVYLLCLVGIQVGNRYDNKRLVLNQAGKNTLRLLVTTLRIKPKAENGTTLTLARVMTCFPEVAVALVSKARVPMLLPFEELQAIHADFPMIARTQVVAAIVPRTLKIEEKRLALALMVVSSLLTSKSIQRIKSDFEFQFGIESECDDDDFMLMFGINRKLQKAEQALKYVTESFKSKVLSDEKRMEYALKFGVVDAHGALSPTWMATGMASMAWLKDNYDYDISTSPEHCHESS